MTKEQREAYHKGVLEMAKMRRAMKRKNKHPPDTVEVKIALEKLNHVRSRNNAIATRESPGDGRRFALSMHTSPLSPLPRATSRPSPTRDRPWTRAGSLCKTSNSFI